MKWLAFALFALLAAGCSSGKTSASNAGGTQSPDVKDLTPIEGLSRYAFAQPVSYGNLTVVPIVDNGPEVQIQTEKQQDYVSLEQAKKNGWIEIHELGEGEVPRVEVMNKGEKAILLLAGELLLGGKQDRVVAKDTVVPPGKTMDVPVFCVDHDRWTGDRKFESAGAMVPQSVRDKTIFQDQQQVWAEVAEFNAGMKITPGIAAEFGKSIRGGLSSKEVQGRIASDLPKFKTALDGRQNVVGFVYVLNGEVRNMELFGTSRLFASSRDSLLKGYLADAAVAKADKAGRVSLSDCAKFMKDVMAGERRQTDLDRGRALWITNADGYSAQETTLPEAKDSRPTGGGAGAFLHGSYSKK